jgi:hypothetical protein
MASAGRFACVALPFALMVCSIICIMIAMLSGIANKNLYMFELEAKNLSISTSNILGVDLKGSVSNGLGQINDALSPNRHNFSASELGLSDYYKVNLWNYCSFNQSKENDQYCSKGKFDWASTAIDLTHIKQIVQQQSNSNNATVPEPLNGSLKTFKKVHKWTQVVYIIAIMASAFTLFLGIAAIFSKIASCITYIVSGIASTSLVIASSMATAESAIVIGAVKTVRKEYHINGHINTSWLAVTWIAVLFSFGAGIFWLASICCCSASSGKSSRRSRGGDQEKLIPTGAYQRVDDPHHFNAGAGGGAFSHGAGAVPMKPMNRGNGAYEPYSHQAI